MKYVKQRLQEYPFIHGISLALMGSAVDLLIHVGPNPTGQWTVGLLAILALLGGLFTIIGLQWRGGVIWANGVERIGHILMGAAWTVDAVIIYGEVRFGILVPVALAAASAVRIYMLGRRNKAIVHNVQQLGSNRHG